MKYQVPYECRTDGQVFHGDFEINRLDDPKYTDPIVIELALKDSVKFSQAGQGGIKIVSVSPKDE